MDGELDYWQGVVSRVGDPLPVDRSEGTNEESTAETVRVELSESETRSLLKEVPGAYRTQINDVLLAALGRTLCGWSGRESVVVDLEGHGREELFEDVDLSRTVGWFTTLYPVELSTGGDWGSTLKTVKERLRGVPGRGLGYGLVRYLRGAAGLESRSCVSFNYLGQFDRDAGHGCGDASGGRVVGRGAQSLGASVARAGGERGDRKWPFAAGLHVQPWSARGVDDRASGRGLRVVAARADGALSFG